MNLVINLCVAKRGALSVMLRQNALLLHRRIFFSTLLPARAKTMLLPTYKAPPFTSQCGRAMKRTILLQSQYFSTKGRKKSKCNSSSDLSGDENLSEKEIALREALSQISASFGKESVMWLGRFTGSRSVPVISTGSVNLDMALGIGGLPKGRVVEIYGPEASGKTTLALHAIAEAQRSGGYCAFIDAEHALDPSLAEGIGVNTKNLLLSQPDYGEQALSIVDTLVRSGTIDVIVVDSVAALVPRTELEGEMGDSHIALQARLMSQALRKLTPSLARSQTLLIFTNQVRHKLSTFGGSFGGPTEVTAGGNALKFYASVRLNIRRLGQVKKGEEVVGSQVQVKIVKNKLAPPFKTADFEIEFGRGISRETEVIELGCKHGLVKKSGGWIWINSMDVDGKEGPKLHGKEGAKLYLKENVDVQNDLISKIKDKFLKSLAGEENLDDEESGADSPEDLSASEKTEMVKVIGEV